MRRLYASYVTVCCRCKIEMPTNINTNNHCPLISTSSPQLPRMKTPPQPHPKNPFWCSSFKLVIQAFLSVGFKWNMALEAKRPTMSNSRRGFYVRMKLLHKHAGPQQQEKKKNLCFRYYKCLLWFSLSLYFFSSYFITHKPIPLSRTQDSKSKTVVSRTLFESSNSTLNQQNKNVNRGMSWLSLQGSSFVFSRPMILIVSCSV